MNAPTDDKMLKAALHYAAAGWQVFPCSQNDKHPLLPKETARGARDGGLWLATTDEAKIRNWWRTRHGAMIGVRMGTGCGAFALDFDPCTDPETGEVISFQDLLAETEALLGEPLPATLTSLTPRGGRHMLFRAPEGVDLASIGNSRGVLPKHIDVRGDGGYIVIAPSIRSGPKAVADGCDGVAYRWIDAKAEIAVAPAVLIDALQKKGRFAEQARPMSLRAPSKGPSVFDRQDKGREARERYGHGALARIKAEVASTSIKRGSAVFRGACAAGRLVAARAISEREALAALLDASDANGLIGKDGQQHVEREILNGIATGFADAGDMIARVEEIESEAEDRLSRRAARHAPPAADYPDMPDYGMDRPDSGAPAFGEDIAALPESYPGEHGDFGDPDASEGGDGGDDLSMVDLSVVEACAALDHSDTDNARRLILHLGKDLCVRSQEGGREPVWCGWAATHWEDINGKAVVTRLAQRIGGLIKLEAAYLFPTPKESELIKAGQLAEKVMADKRSAGDLAAIEEGRQAAKAWEKRKGNRVSFGISSKNKARVSAMMEMTVPHVLIDPSAFNADPLVLVTETHTLRFRRDHIGESGDRVATVEAVKGHDRADLVTRIVPHRWNPGAPVGKWQAMLNRFQPDPEQRRFLQVSAGLGVLGLTEQVLIFHYGSGANSKSVFLECLCRVLGSIAKGLPAEAISGDDKNSGLKASPEIARLYGVRFVRISEIPQGEPLKEEFVKRITGGERFPARNLFEGYFEFLPIFIPHMSGNGYPRIVGIDNGIWRRMRVVHWPVQLEDREMRNFEDVVADLMTEAEGILAWLVEGARIYLEEGLVTPDSVKAATEAMRAANDPVKRFFEDAVIVTGNEQDRVSAGHLYAAYVPYSAGDHTAVNKTRFGINMTEIAKACGVVKAKSSAGIIEYIGIRLKRDTGLSDPGWTPDAGG